MSCVMFEKNFYRRQVLLLFWCSCEQFYKWWLEVAIISAFIFGINLLGKTAVENHEDDYKLDAEDEDADNGEEGSKVEEFKQEAN